MKEQKRYLRKKISPRFFFILFFCLASVTLAEAQTIKGTVKSDGIFGIEPAAGASIIVKGTTTATMADIDGKFSIRITDPKTVLIFSLLNHNKKEVIVGTQTEINVILKEETKELGEVVVIGFQTQEKITLTGALSHVGAETLQDRPVTNIGQALQGVVPGVNVNIASGKPNAIPSFNIRGGTTIREGAVEDGSPLILMDGIEVSGEDLNQFNPNDIESITFLKDASSAAIYGTRATFGVVLVTTKAGKFNQKSKITYTYDITLDQPLGLPDILDSYTWQKQKWDKRVWQMGGNYSEEELEFLSRIKNFEANPIDQNAWWDKGNGKLQWVGNYNPYDNLIKSWTPVQKHNVNITGGGNKISYFVSLGTQTQEGMYKPIKDEARRYNMMMSVNAEVTDWFKVGAKVSYNIYNFRSPLGDRPGQGNLWHVLKSQNPEKNLFMPAMIANAELENIGLYGPQPTESSLSYIYSGAQEKTSRKTGVYSLSPEFTVIPKELRLKADLSLSPMNYQRISNNPKQTRINDTWTPTASYGTQENTGNIRKSNNYNYAINAYADYRKEFDKKRHVIGVLLGVNQERRTTNSTYVTLRNLLNPLIVNPESVENQATTRVTESYTEQTARAVFTHLMYHYQGKYLFDFNARYDGSSKFPKENRYHIFPTVSGAWRISEEKFMTPSRSWLDNLKVRASWGKLGSQPTSSYPYQVEYTAASSNYLFGGTSFPSTVNVPKLVNPYLEWEKATTTNIGIDAAFLNSKLDVVLEGFQRVTTDILMSGGVAAYPALLGAVPPVTNLGQITTKGWELTLNWRDKFADGKVRYDVKFTLTDGYTKVDKAPGNPTNDLSKMYEGQRNGDIWGFETGGVLQAGDFDGTKSNGYPNYPGPTWGGTTQEYPGNVWLIDRNGDGLISAGDNTKENPGDRMLVGNKTPRYKYGITTNIQFAGFDLNMFFQGVAKRDFWVDRNSTFWGTGAGSEYMLDNSWTPLNTNAKYPIYGSLSGQYAGGIYKTQSGFMTNASYFMFKQAVLGYTLPSRLVKKYGIQKLRVNVSAFNLFSITDVPKMFDPEQLTDVYPPLRRVAFGLQVVF